jgi:hypothetical protein
VASAPTSTTRSTIPGRMESLGVGATKVAVGQKNASCSSEIQHGDQRPNASEQTCVVDAESAARPGRHTQEAGLQ